MGIQGVARSARSGFTLVELMIVVAIISIVASLAVPRVTAARASAQESAAVAHLRSLTSAQAQIQASAAIDTDRNGMGEFGSYGELTGLAPMRIAGLLGPEPGVLGIDELDPPVFPQAFGALDANAVVHRSGYVFKLYLPADGNAPVGISESPGGGFQAAPFPDPTNAQYFWCAYAWPYEVGRTGNRCFFVNQEGEVLASANRGGAGGTPIYSGMLPDGHPPFEAAYLDASMAAPAAFRAQGADGNLWVPVQ